MGALETKVAAQGSVALAVGYLAQIVLTIISQHTTIKIDATLANEITVFATVVAGWVAGYFAPHTHRPDLITSLEPVAASVGGTLVQDIPAAAVAPALAEPEQPASSGPDAPHA